MTRARQGPDPGITIAELAALTGVGEATLRVWETRHGAPKPRRLPNGHRRYSRQDVELVSATVEHRRAGMAVPAALRCARAAITAAPDSIFAAIRDAFPDLVPAPLHKPALVRISHAIEDECLARAVPGLLIGAFQRERFYRQAEDRWADLAANMQTTIVLADFRRRRVRTRAPTEIPLVTHSPLAREWVLIGTAGCLLARERPGGGSGVGGVVFDAIWSPDPEVIHRAACVAIALFDDQALASRATAALGPAPGPSSPELRRAVALTNRIITYVAG